MKYLLRQSIFRKKDTQDRPKGLHFLSIKGIITLLMVLLVPFSEIFSSNVGDYRSSTTGNWTSLATWQRYNGSTWLTPTSAQGYPGQYSGTGNVTLISGHIITIGTSGITTQKIGVLTIQNNAQLYLTGSNSMIIFSINTPTITIETGGSIYFANKASLTLTTDAVVTLTIGAGGLTGSCSNNVEIVIGGKRFAACAGAPGDVFTFAQLMSMGGTLNAIPSSNSPLCEGNTITLTGDYQGAIGTTPTYHWSIKAPGGAITTYSTKNVNITNAVPGTYTAELTVSTILGGTTYNNHEVISVVVNPLPTLSNVTQAYTVCPGSQASINLDGLVPNSTFTVNYSINNVPQTPVSGLISSSGGTSSFSTPSLSESDSGKTLRITGMTITNPTTNCQKSFSKDLTLSVYKSGGGTWTGRTNTDWNTSSNWCGGVPTTITDVVIFPNSTSVLYQPQIGNSGGSCRNITIHSNASLTIAGSNSLHVFGTWINNGNFTANTSTVSFLSSSTTQTISGSGTNVFHHLTINNTGGGVTSASSLTVNGVLNLQSSNPTASKGVLNLWDGSEMKTLTMGANATTTGIGDVTGYLRRTTFSAYTAHSFGHQHTTVSFASGGTYPSELKVKITIGAAPGWKTGAILRVYDFVQTGGNNCYATIRTHYLDSELNGNDEKKLTQWTYGANGQQPAGAYEWGHSNSSFQDNWVEIANVNIGHFPTSFGNLENTLANSQSVDYTWDGSESTDWTDVDNWTPAGSPNATSNIIIPDASTTPNDPVLITTEIKTMTLEPGAILYGGSSTVLTINGDQGAWNNQGGIFYPQTNKIKVTNTSGSVTVSGTTQFYDIEIVSGAKLSLTNGTVVKISGTVTNNGSVVAEAGGETTVEYNGGDQTVIVPNSQNPRYFHLTLSGSGSKTMPGVAMNIYGNLTIAGSASVSLNNSLTLHGNLILGSGTTFSAGTSTHTLAGNFENNGATFNTTGSTLICNGSSAQTLGGSSSSTFNNLTINNSSGVILGIGETISGTLNMLNGLVSTGNYTLTLECNATVTNASTSSYIDGKLARMYCSTGSKEFPIGKDGNYRPFTLEYTALNETSTVTAEQIEVSIPGTIPSYTYKGPRHWEITESGGSNYSYTLSLNGSPCNPGSGNPKILKGDGTNNTAISATFNSPYFTITGQTSFSKFATGSECAPATLITQPVSTSSCDEDGNPSFQVIASVPNGTLFYQWEESVNGINGPFTAISDGGKYSGATTSTLQLTNPGSDMNGNAYRVKIQRDCGNEIISDTAILTINSIPSIQLGSNPEICRGVTKAELSYSAAVGNPDLYSIDFDIFAENAGFNDVSLTGLPSSPICISVPDTNGTFSGCLTVKNSTTGCYSNCYPFSITLRPLPQGSLTGNSICSGETGQLTWHSSCGTGPFTVVYNDGSDHTATNVYSGQAFDVYAPQNTTKNYDVISVSGIYCSRSSNFSGATATVTVESGGLWRGTISSDWFDAANWCGGVPTATTDVTISSSSYKPVINGQDAVCRNLTINQYDSLYILSNSLSIKGNLYNQGNIVASSAAEVVFDGSNQQSLGGENYTSFAKLTIDNASGFVAENSLTVRNELNLQSGLLDLSGNTLTIGTPTSNGTITGGNSSSYILAYNNGDPGIVRYMINDKNNATYLFPIGDNDEYSPLIVEFQNDTYSIENAYLDVFVSDDVLPGLNSSLGDFISRYWTVNPGGKIVSPKFTIKMIYTDDDINGDESNLFPVKYSEDSWFTCNENTNIENGKMGSGLIDTENNMLSWRDVTSFSRFGGAGGSGQLPIELVTFTANCDVSPNTINLQWTTFNETNNDFFTLERKTDMTPWERIAVVKGSGNSNHKNSYTFSDRVPEGLFDPIIFYKLSQTDYNGTSKVCGIIKANPCSQTHADFSAMVYPNPGNHTITVRFNTTSRSPYSFEISNMEGIILQRINNVSEPGMNELKISLAEIPQGVFMLRITSDRNSKIIKFIKQ